MESRRSRRDLHLVIRSLQAQALVASVEEATTLVDNTLEAEAEVEYFTGSPGSPLAVLNFDSFSRVLALGVETSETREYIVTIRGFFEARSQSCFRIKITLAGRPKNSSESTLLHSSDLSKTVSGCRIETLTACLQ